MRLFRAWPIKKRENRELAEPQQGTNTSRPHLWALKEAAPPSIRDAIQIRRQNHPHHYTQRDLPLRYHTTAISREVLPQEEDCMTPKNRRCPYPWFV